MTDYELENLYPTEDPFYLSKKTRIFCMLDPANYKDLDLFPNFLYSYNKFGYENVTIHEKRTIEEIASENDTRGYRLHFDKSMVTNQDIVDWYTFADIIRKIRVLDDPVIITKPNTRLMTDIKISILDKPFDMEFFGVGGNKRREQIIIPTGGIIISPKYAVKLMEYITTHRIPNNLEVVLMNHYIRKIAPAYRFKHGYAKVT